MVLLGMVPVLMHTPPTSSRLSTSATRLPRFTATTADRCPEGPEPITNKSYSFIAGPEVSRSQPRVVRANCNLLYATRTPNYRPQTAADNETRPAAKRQGGSANPLRPSYSPDFSTA